MTTMVLPKGFRLPPPENITLKNPRIVDISGWSNEKLADTILEYEKYNSANSADADADAAAAAKAANSAKAAAAKAAAAKAADAAAAVADRNKFLPIVKGKRPIFYKLSGGLRIFIGDAKEGQMMINDLGQLVPMRVGPYMTLPKGLRLKAPTPIRGKSPEQQMPEFQSGDLIIQSFIDPDGFVTLEKTMVVHIDGWSNEKLADRLAEYEKYNSANSADAAAAKAAAAKAAAAKAADAAAAVADRNKFLPIVKGKRPIFYKLSGGLRIFIGDAKEGQMMINDLGQLVPMRVGPYMTLPKGLRLKAPERTRGKDVYESYMPAFQSGDLIIQSFIDPDGFVTLEKTMVVHIDGWSDEKLADRLAEHEKYN